MYKPYDSTVINPRTGYGLFATGAYNAYNTYTEVMQNKKMKYQMENQNTTMGQSTFVVKGRVRPFKGLSRTKIKYHDQYLATVGTLSNQKKFKQICSVGTRSQWLFNTVQNNLCDVSLANWFSLDHTKGVAPTDRISTVAMTENNPLQRMVALNGVVHLDILNISSLAGFLKIHAFQAIEDNEDEVCALLANSFFDQRMYDTNWTFPAAAGQPSTTSGNPNYSYSNSTSTDQATIDLPVYQSIQYAKNVRNQWRYLGNKAVNMAGGDNHRVTIPYVINQMGDKDRLMNAGPTYYPKGCIVFYAEIQGALALDTTTTTGTYGLSAVQLKFSVSRQVNFGVMKDKSTNYRTGFFGNPGVSGKVDVPANKTLVQGVFSAAAGVLNA